MKVKYFPSHIERKTGVFTVSKQKFIKKATKDLLLNGLVTNSIFIIMFHYLLNQIGFYKLYLSYIFYALKNIPIHKQVL